MPKIVCPSCRTKIHPPNHRAGHHVMCPRCHAAIAVPTKLVQAVEEATHVQTSSSSPEEMPFPLVARLGILSLVLSMISFFLLCAPFGNYLSIGLSSIGL